MAAVATAPVVVVAARVALVAVPLLPLYNYVWTFSLSFLQISSTPCYK